MHYDVTKSIDFLQTYKSPDECACGNTNKSKNFVPCINYYSLY